MLHGKIFSHCLQPIIFISAETIAFINTIKELNSKNTNISQIRSKIAKNLNLNADKEIENFGISIYKSKYIVNFSNHSIITSNKSNNDSYFINISFGYIVDVLDGQNIQASKFLKEQLSIITMKKYITNEQDGIFNRVTSVKDADEIYSILENAIFKYSAFKYNLSKYPKNKSGPYFTSAIIFMWCKKYFSRKMSASGFEFYGESVMVHRYNNLYCESEIIVMEFTLYSTIVCIVLHNVYVLGTFYIHFGIGASAEAIQFAKNVFAYNIGEEYK